MKMKIREIIIFIEIIIRLKVENHHLVKNVLGKDQGIKIKVMVGLY